MYEQYWQLNEKPFESTHDRRFYFPAESHQSSLLKLRYSIENKRNASLITGASGLGKTRLIKLLSDQLSDSFRPLVHLVFPQMPPDQLLAYIARGLVGEPLPHPMTVAQSIETIETRLRENANESRHAVIVLDEVHLITSSESLEAIRLLLNFEEGGLPLASLVLVGQPSFMPTLDRLPELDERISVKCVLKRFTEEETRNYVSHRLTAAGCRQPIFEDSAIATLHQLAHGVPRRINRLADLALLVGFAEELTAIRSAEIESVAEELITVHAE